MVFTEVYNVMMSCPEVRRKATSYNISHNGLLSSKYMQQFMQPSKENEITFNLHE